MVVATHDVEFVAGVADEVVVLADGEVVSAGPVREVVVESPSFAPQVTKILGRRGCGSTRSPAAPSGRADIAALALRRGPDERAVAIAVPLTRRSPRCSAPPRPPG